MTESRFENTCHRPLPCSDFTLQWTVNGIQYESPDLPTLLKVIANGFTTEADFSPSEHTFVLNRNQIIDLVIHGSANGSSNLLFSINPISHSAVLS